jgi:pimeloyl-ACP methyl ester carboxylesterase
MSGIGNERAAAGDAVPRDIFVTAQDGLRLHVRVRGMASDAQVPVVCLPGLTRTVADFDALGEALAGAPSRRRVIAIDSRGRGQSGYDNNPANYNLAVELGDVITVLDTLEIRPAVFVGSSRGGLLTMLLAANRPAALAGAVLHDIGPVIEPAGLARIKSYVGRLAAPRSFADGGEILRHLFGAAFPKVSPQQWLAAAHRAWRLDDGRFVPTYDTALARTLASVDITRPLPAMWNEFDALAAVPLLVIHGALSDILSAATVDAMRRRHPDMAVIAVPDQGHVPLLEGEALLGAVANFIARCDPR